MHNLFKNVKVQRLTIDGTNYILAAGTSDVNSGIFDTLGFEGVAFILELGVIAASGAVSVKAQQGAASNMSDAADLTGTSQGATADTDDNKCILIDLGRPAERYVRLAITRGDGGNSTIDGLIALGYNPAFGPVTHDTTTVFGAEYFNHPGEGTA
jgi:hypothetical protein